MKYFVLPAILSVIFAFPVLSSAQTQAVNQMGDPTGESISGDDLCGSSNETKCDLGDIKELVSETLELFIIVGGTILVAYVAIMLVKSWFAYRSGNAGAIKEAGTRAFNAFIGFILIVAVFGGLYAAALKTFGTQPWVVDFLKYFSEALVPHAYAANEFFPSPTQGATITDLILAGVSLLIRFFVFPAIIAMWVWSGFQFVYARGNPAGLQKAKAWLLYAVIITIVVFSLQGFMNAFIGTAKEITGENQEETVAPAPSPSSSVNASTQCEIIVNEAQRNSCFTARAAYRGQSCSLNTYYGQIGVDGRCYVGGPR